MREENTRSARLTWLIVAPLLVAIVRPGAVSGQVPSPVVPGPGLQLHPAVAWTYNSSYNRNVLIVWEDWRHHEACCIYGARVNGSDILLDTQGIRISDGGRNNCNPAVVGYHNQPFLVVWEDWRNSSPAIYGARVTIDGTVLDPDGIRISRDSDAARNPAVTYAPSTGEYLVVWEENASDSLPHIVGARVLTSGLVLDTVPIRISNGPGWQVHAVVDCERRTPYCAVVWESHSAADDTVLVCGARIDTYGRLVDPTGIRICTTASRQTDPSIAADFRGVSCLVVWQDNRRDSTAICCAQCDTALRSLNPWGTSLDSSQNCQCHPWVSWCDAQGGFLACWEEHSETAYSQVRLTWVQDWHTIYSPFSISDTLDMSAPASSFYDNYFFVVMEGSRPTLPASRARPCSDVASMWPVLMRPRAPEPLPDSASSRQSRTTTVGSNGRPDTGARRSCRCWMSAGESGASNTAARWRRSTVSR